MRGRIVLSLVGLMILAALVIEFWPNTNGPAYTRVTEVRTLGGLEAYLASDSTLPILTMNVFMPAGSAFDPPDKRGVSSLMVRLLDEGAGDLDAHTFQSQLEDLAIDLSFEPSRDYLVISLKTTTATLDQAFHLLRLALNEPRFDADAVERMRTGTLAAIRRAAGDPSAIGRDALFQKVFGDHPYAFDVKGTDASVRSLTVEDIRAFHQARVTRENLSIGVAGDIDAGRLAVLLDQTFGPLPAKATGEDIPVPTPVFDGEMTNVPVDIPQATVLMVQPGLMRNDPSWHAFYVLNYIMGGGGFQSRLMDEVREKRGLAYGASSTVYPLQKTGIWLANTATESSRVGESVTVIRQEWARMAAEGPTQQEVDEAKTYLLGAWPLNFTSTGSVAAMLASMRLWGLPSDYITTRNDIVAGLSRDDIVAVARRVMDPSRLGGVIVGPAASELHPTPMPSTDSPD